MRQHQPRARRRAKTQICLTIWGPVGGRHGARCTAAGTCRAHVEDDARASATAASAPAARGIVPAVSAAAAAGGARRRQRARAAAAELAALVAAGRADAARRGAAPLDARPAELLVRRGVHARPRPAPEPVGDAALGRPHREHAAAVVPARVGRLARARAPARSRCACRRRSPGSRPCRSPGRSAASSPAARAAIAVRGARRRQPAVRVVLAGGARVRAVRADWRRSRCSASCAPSASPRRARMAAFALSGVAGAAERTTSPCSC